MSERYTITAALPYTNGPIHIGHLAGVYVPADIFARYQRLKNNDVAFICGSDEHGVAISIKAKKEGTTPQEIIDKYNKIIKDSLFDFGISFDNYSRTSLPIHYQTASEFFRTLYDKGDFIEETSEQLYDEQAGQFLADRFVIGTCPKCGNEEAYGDQCERCGTSLNATDLINPKSTLTGSKPVLRQTKHWFLPLQDYTEFLEKWIIEGHKNDWKPNVYGQVKSWIDDGLRPRAVTRDLDWGIPVPVEGAEGKVLYVWFDAPIGYISSTKEWAAREGKDWEPYWKDKKTKLIHFIGKDNIVFHCIIFPTMLKAEGSYILPENVPANEFLNLEGNKLSTSKNWAVWLNEYLEEFPSQQDTLRYVITANAPETKDNDFTWKDFQARNNNELVAIYGNFINRVMVLTDKYYKGVVPSVGELTQVDREVFAQIKELIQKIEQSLERYRFREAQQELMNIARLGNKYLADEEPWKLIKEDPKRVETIMYIALHIATALAVTSEPFLPFTSEKLKRMLNFSTMEKAPTWQDIPLSDRLIPQGHTIGEAVLLFEKIEDEAIEKQIAKLEKSKQANKQAITNDHTTVVPQKELISYEDFAKMDIRIGTILEAEKMPKADKLLILKVDTGIDQRTIVSGIAQSFDPKEIIGKKVTVLANLAPRKLRGVESHGMILMVENSAGKYVFLNPDAEGIANGTEVK
ncbi:methionine--tRNA ligase [Capnocytophaga gingivalis]|uniref:methionine--tRNA ligase n=1 Tax=Capnocytophaga gingivalis TaxID=1017 RepID=UPI0028D188EC|nr:methionine--tRNA ligase [Capnocytophaga gingivalis]